MYPVHGNSTFINSFDETKFLFHSPTYAGSTTVSLETRNPNRQSVSFLSILDRMDGEEIRRRMRKGKYPGTILRTN